MGRILLITGSVLNIIIGLLHVAALFFFLDWALAISGGDILFDKFGGIIPGSPYTETAVVSVAFILMGLYGLSAARVIRKLPLLKPGIALITIIYFVRGILGLAYEILSEERLMNGIIFSSIAIFIGICYFYGAIWRWHGHGQGKYYEDKTNS